MKKRVAEALQRRDLDMPIREIIIDLTNTIETGNLPGYQEVLNE